MFHFLSVVLAELVLVLECRNLFHLLSVVLAGASASAGVPLVLRDAFVTPSFDELDAVAVDSKGDPKSLHHQHLRTIREHG